MCCLLLFSLVYNQYILSKKNWHKKKTTVFVDRNLRIFHRRIPVRPSYTPSRFAGSNSSPDGVDRFKMRSSAQLSVIRTSCDNGKPSYWTEEDIYNTCISNIHTYIHTYNYTYIYISALNAHPPGSRWSLFSPVSKFADAAPSYCRSLLWRSGNEWRKKQNDKKKQPCLLRFLRLWLKCTLKYAKKNLWQSCILVGEQGSLSNGLWESP